MITKETYTIGLVFPDVSNPFFADIIQGERLAHSRGYHVFLCNTEEDSQRELAVILVYTVVMRKELAQVIGIFEDTSPKILLR